MPWSLSLTVTTRSLYAVTGVESWRCARLVEPVVGGSVEPLACAVTCAHDVVIVLPPLKLAAVSGVVLERVVAVSVEGVSGAVEKQATFE
jgi:hypothetical protein